LKVTKHVWRRKCSLGGRLLRGGGKGGGIGGLAFGSLKGFPPWVGVAFLPEFFYSVKLVPSGKAYKEGYMTDKTGGVGSQL